MISFPCSSCGRTISVDEKYSGKKGKCPKCGGIVTVPAKSTVIVFHCRNCEHKIKVPGKYGGKKGKCPKCHETVVIPSLEKEKAVAEKMVSVTCQMCGQVIEVPEHTSEAFTECPSCSGYIETSFGDAMVESHTSIQSPVDEQQYEEESEEYEESAGIDRRLIIIISAVAAVVVVGLVILVAALKLSRPQPQRQPQVQLAADTPESRSSTDLEGRMETDFEGAKAFAEQYIRLLESGDIDEAYKHHGPELAKDVYRFSFEKLSEQISSSRIIDMNCTQVQNEQYPGGDQIVLSYDLSCEQGMQSINMTVLSSGQDFKVNEISAKDSRGYSTMIGIRTPGSPSSSRAATSPRRTRPSSGAVFTAIITGFAIGTFFSAICLWIGMKITRVEGTFVAMLGIAAISSLASTVPMFICFTPCVGWLLGLVVMFVLICKWTDAEFWPDAIGIVLISGVVGILARMLLGFIISMA
jgi:predicted RNA-binding Zn-ribbon protein involved in translation (DUF1610 family)